MRSNALRLLGSPFSPSWVSSQPRPPRTSLPNSTANWSPSAANPRLPYAAPDLPQAKYIALYFSAGWCRPCHQFTPELVKFYNEMKPKHPGFEVVFMSAGPGANAMEKYMSEMVMPWPAVRYSVAKTDRALTNTRARHSRPGGLERERRSPLRQLRRRQYVGPYKVMDDLRKLLDRLTPAPAVSRAPTPRTPRASDRQIAQWHELGATPRRTI